MDSSNGHTEGGQQLVGYDESLAVAEIGIGLNLRLFRWLSVGLMYDRLFVAESDYRDLIAAILYQDQYGNDMGFSSLTATLGIHF